MTRDEIRALIDKVADQKVWMKWAIDRHARYEEVPVYEAKLDAAVDQIIEGTLR